MKRHLRALLFAGMVLLLLILAVLAVFAPPGYGLTILMYHHVVPDGVYCNDWTIEISRLREDFLWLLDHGYTPILPSEIVETRPLPEKAVLITFDDGYVSNYELAFPLMKELGVKAVISPIVSYIVDGPTEFLTWDMCREMAASGLVEFGSHTYDAHEDDPPGIERLPQERREDYEARIFLDLQMSIDVLESQLGEPVLLFAYPHGQIDRWASDYVKTHFAMSVTTNHGKANTFWGLYDLPRLNVNMDRPLSRFLPA